MSRRCSVEKASLVAFYILYSLVCLSRHFHGCHGTILSKGKIMMCLKDSETDPFNVVHNKKCNKKLVITKAVTAGQKPTEYLYINVSKVQDEVDRDQARLYNPFIVTITQSPLHLVYPYHLIGLVNNKPFETSKRGYWCNDGGNTKNDLEFSCKVSHDKTTGERIWDSQGFCCRCAYGEDKTTRRRHRGNTVCGSFLATIPFLSYLFKNKKRQSSHCMNYDKLWYNVYKIGPYSIWFKIFVKAYDLVIEEKDGISRQKLVDGGQITLSNFKTSGHGIHGRILATLVGLFESDTQFYSLTEKYLLMPNKDSEVSWETHAQTRNGAQDYLIVQRSDVMLDNPMESCDKIGVSFTAFRMQGGHDGQGPGCTREMGSCLNNQIKDFFELDTVKTYITLVKDTSETINEGWPLLRENSLDMTDIGLSSRNKKRRNGGKHPYYFPERYGEVLNTQQYDSSGGYALVYKITKRGTSMVNLEISADDIILIYNKATGIIVKAFATDFESLSQDGHLNVIVQNTGLVTADFFVTVAYCSLGILKSPEMAAAINPQAIHTFDMELRTTVHVSDKFMCTVNLWDARHGYLDSANISFETSKACVCLQSCSCACTGTADTERCILKGDTVSDEYQMFKNLQLVKHKLEGLERFFYELNDSLNSIVNLFTKPTLSGTLKIWFCLSLLFGLLKARLGNKPGGAPIAYLGWWFEQPAGQELFVDSKGSEIMGMYNKEGELIDPRTGEVLKSEKLLLFVGNVLFFWLLICNLGVRAARLYKEWDNREEMVVSLSNVALTCTTVYRNISKFADAEKYLTNPGVNFSLAGKLERVKRNYKFVIVDHMQIIEIIEDNMLLLIPELPFDPAAFSQVYTEEDTLREVSLQPLYVCLNEQPLFDYYSNDEEEPVTSHHSDGEQSLPLNSSSSDQPPTPPIPDYSFHESPYENDNLIYEKPVQ